MGNWMRVHIVGSCPAESVDALRKAIDPDGPERHYHALCGGDGLAGLGDWAGEHINVVGNCYERDFTPEEVGAALATISDKAQGLSVDVHCGADYEADEAVATVQLRRGAVVILRPPLVTKIPPIPDGQIASRLMAALAPRRGE